MTRPVTALALVVTTCSCSVSGPSALTALRQAYRAEVITPAGDRIPFLLEAPANCNRDKATIVNGAERISVACQRLGTRLLLDFVVYGTRIAPALQRMSERQMPFAS